MPRYDVKPGLPREGVDVPYELIRVGNNLDTVVATYRDRESADIAAEVLGFLADAEV